MLNIAKIIAYQILDSRGCPTLEAKVSLSNGVSATASVPSGASTGKLEACELRDNNLQFYFGKSVLKAVENVNIVIANKLAGFGGSQQELDNILINLDGTKNKSKLGANAILAVSLAVAKAYAKNAKLSLFSYLGGNSARVLPVPLMNIINGGKHANNSIDIQEFMIAPVGANSMSDAICAGAEVFFCLKNNLHKKGYSTSVGDEGGFAPNFSSATQTLDFISEAVHQAGYKIGSDILLALDCASSEFYENSIYNLVGENKKLNSLEIIDYYQKLVDSYPIFSIEDPMAEDDISGWQNITSKLGKKVQLVGDDLFVTNPQILAQGIKQNLANAVLIKPNQIGTLTETLQTIDLAKQNNYNNIISHRSGETEDATIAHLAVATNAGQIKTGSLCRSDRTAKYNELLRIEHELGLQAIYAGNQKGQFRFF